MKKILSFLIPSLTLISLSACSGAETSTFFYTDSRDYFNNYQVQIEHEGDKVTKSTAINYFPGDEIDLDDLKESWKQFKIGDYQTFDFKAYDFGVVITEKDDFTHLSSKDRKALEKLNHNQFVEKGYNSFAFAKKEFKKGNIQEKENPNHFIFQKEEDKIVTQISFDQGKDKSINNLQLAIYYDPKAYGPKAVEEYKKELEAKYKDVSFTIQKTKGHPYLLAHLPSDSKKNGTSLYNNFEIEIENSDTLILTLLEQKFVETNKEGV